jgi:ATP-binding cassette, subfamily B, bacterial
LSAALFGGVGLQLLAPQILRDVIDGALAKDELSGLVRLALGYLAVGVGAQLFSAFGAWLGADIGWRVTNRLREELMDHVLRLDMGFHGDKPPGEFIERIDGDVSALSTFFSTLFISMAGGMMLGVGVLVLLWREHPYVGAAMTVFALGCTLVLFRIRHLGESKAVEQREASSQLFGFLEERLAGIEDIRANGAGAFIMDGFLRANHRFFHVTRIAWILRSAIYVIALLLFVCGDILSLGLGAWFQAQGLITVGTVILMFRYTAMLRGPIEMVTHQIQDLQRASASLQRINEMLSEKSAIVEGAGVTWSKDAPALNVSNLTFAYSLGNPVLRDVCFDIAPGQHLGLLGRTGSGKTTLTRLMSRLYDPQEGTIVLGGHDIRDARLSELRRHIGVVTQSVHIFNASVRDNLRLFDADVPDAHIRDVLEQLGLASWLAGFKKGLDTVLDGGGRGLSSGEAQLLALVRVFLLDPALVILDEPSSRLDPHTEALLQKAMRALLHDRTAIIIAHRLATVRHVDDILILHDGSVVEHGKREALERDPNSRFAHLLKSGLEADLI